MDADKCQEDLNAVSEQPESDMEKTAVSETKEQERAPAAVEEPELSPVSDKLTTGSPEQVPESAAQSEETPETKPEEQHMPPGVSEKMEEEPVGTEAPSDGAPAQPRPDSPPEKVSEAPQQETQPSASEVVLARPQPDGSPEKVSKAPEQDVPQDASQKVDVPTGAEEPSEAQPAQHQPEAAGITMGTESEKLQLEQQPAAQSDPEPKAAEPVPELAHQTSPEPDRVEKATHKEEMPAPEGEEEEEVVKPVDPTGIESVKQLQTEAEELNTKEVKEEQPKTPAEPGPAAEAAMEQVEQKEANDDHTEPTKEEEEEEATVVPAPGSLAFALLEHEPTKAALRASRTLIVLRGLPGSGKTFLARAIADSYQNLCSVVTSDDHDVTSADGYKALDEAVIACCGGVTGPASVVVVDDTNHTHDRLARLAEIGEQNRRVVLFLEPLTEWRLDPPQLVKKTGRGLEEAQIQAMKATHEEVSIPLFYGWFLLQDKIKCTAMDFLKTLDSLDAFKKHLADFPVETEKEVDLEQYFHSNWSLHCTTKYCGNGKVKGAREYSQQTAVKEMYGTVSELSLTALFVTPRTFGARVSLSQAQLAVWPADAEKEDEIAVPGAGGLPTGSRAHVSLGCAEKVEPVQTGLDLLDILVLQQAGQQGELVEEMELGTLVYLDKGRWLLTLREPISVQACFSSFYQPKDEADTTKKEPEKKKKPKCSIL